MKDEYFLGLDAAGPIFDYSPIGLNKTCAKFVQVLHTDSGGAGTSLNRGHADFYANKR